MPDPTPTRLGPCRLGIDTGGTFTDFLRLNPDGTLTVHKLRSTPDDPSRAILKGIAELTTGPIDLTHGSTVATNAVLERKGARIAVLITAGFRDLLLIARQTRRELYNFQVEAPRPLVEPGLTFEVEERLTYTGEVLTPLTAAKIERLTQALKQAEVTSVAICLLHSYAHPRHEQALQKALLEQGFQVSASHAILPEYREYERFSTTAVNAYVTPLMSAYLTRLASSLAPFSTLRIMQSNGGSISATQAKAAAVQTILSGPAAGVVGAQAIAAASNHTRIITFDMGGTSTDVALIEQTITRTSDSLVGDLPIRLPVLDIHTVGAGGGSIAWIDTGGSLRVGPRSAGATPGPACYGTGENLTVTDANLLLGRLVPGHFLGGRMTLDLARTERLAQTLADELSLSVQRLAEGIVRIADANMERAIRVVSVQRGHDPRDFALLAFGGAGGLHACALATALDIPTVLIPEHSGVLSALGMLLADVVKDLSTPIHQPTASLTEEALHERLKPLLAQAQQTLALEGFSLADILLEPTLDMRYTGQAYELSIPFTPDFAQAFHRTHARLYGYANPARATEVVQLRLHAIGRTDKPTLTLTHHAFTPQPPPAPTSTQTAWFDGTAHATPIYLREHLVAGTQDAGPAIILTGQSTNVIPPGWAWHIDAPGTLIANRT